MIDIRSDTVTKPSKEMLEHIITAEVGDDEYKEDPTVNELEEFTANLLGFEAGLFVSSGLMGNQISLLNHTNPGDEVITTSHSWISTSEAISNTGGKVVFCDTEVDTFVIDPKEIEKKITKNTVGIIPVHLYGHAANMFEI